MLEDENARIRKLDVSQVSSLVLERVEFADESLFKVSGKHNKRESMMKSLEIVAEDLDEQLHYEK